MMERDAVLVLSGGIDSVTMLYEYRERIALAISFDYGSNHNRKEIPFAELHCKRLGVEHLVIDLEFMHRYFNSSLLQGGMAIPEGNYDEENMRSTVVPFRNGIMLAIAGGFAEDRGLRCVMIANHAGDHAIYPDCRPGFIASMGAALEAGTYCGAKVFAPYTNLTKGEIVARGAKLGVDYAETWSCYKGGDVHCGRCGTCRERMEAFAVAGVKDVTVYE